MRWGTAMRRALYGPHGFYAVGAGPAAHFRTSAHASPLFATAVGRLLARLDEVLGSPPVLDVVDVGAGRGELLTALAAQVPPGLAGRLRRTGVEIVPRPPDLPPEIGWRRTPPGRTTGLLLATEWLDNVPLELAAADPDGTVRYRHTDGRLGARVSGLDARWLARWWPLPPGGQAEIGRYRDEAWRAACRTVKRGLALAVDYGHLAGDRPPLGTLTGYRHGRQVAAVPDGSCDLTAHVAFDSLATPASTLLTQRESLHRLGLSGRRPAPSRAVGDPAGYLRALAEASQVGELTDPAGLGGHRWLLEPVGLGDRHRLLG